MADTVAACEGELASIAMQLHHLALSQARLKGRQLFLRRRLRRLELLALKAEFGEEPGAEADVDAEEAAEAEQGDAGQGDAGGGAEQVSGDDGCLLTRCLVKNLLTQCWIACMQWDCMLAM